MERNEVSPREREEIGAVLEAGIEQLEQEHYELLQQVQKKLDEIKILSQMLNSLESEVDHTQEVEEPLEVHDVQKPSSGAKKGLIDKFIKFRLRHETKFQYVQTGLVGGFAGGGGVQGLLNDPERFVKNLVGSTSLALGVGLVDDAIEWMRYRNRK